MTRITGAQAFEIVEALHGETEFARIERRVSTVAAVCGFNVLAFGVVPNPSRFANTWPEEWLREYRERGYVE